MCILESFNCWLLLVNVCLEIFPGCLLAAVPFAMHSGVHHVALQVNLGAGLNCQLNGCAGMMRAGVALPLAATLQHLCLHAPRRSRAALSVLACIMYFLALISVGNPPTQPHPFWAPVAPSLSWDR